MIPIWTIWVVLLGFRSLLYILGYNTLLLTGLIIVFQIINVYFILEKNHYKMTGWYFIAFFFLILVPYNSATLGTLNVVLAIIILKDIKLQKLINLCFYIIIFEIIIYLCAFYTGFLKDTLCFMPKGIAHSLGFRNPNGPGKFLLTVTIICGLYYLTHHNIRSVFLLMIIPNYYIYKYTICRTAFYTSLAYFFLYIYFSKDSKYTFSRRITTYVPLFLYIATFIACHIYKNYPILDVIFTTRFSKNAYYLSSMTPINWMIGFRVPDGLPMDSAYLAQLFQGGILSVFVFLCVTRNGIINMKLEGIKIFMPFVLSLFISGFAENTFSSFSLETICFYKILIDQFNIKNIKVRYLI